MPKKPKRPGMEVQAIIVTDAKMRLGCVDFAPDFTIHDGWLPNCAQAFNEAVARWKFDTAWSV